jgi:hypothetical protein
MAQSWRLPSTLTGASAPTNYDPTADRPVVPGQLPITDPGQLGAGSSGGSFHVGTFANPGDFSDQRRDVAMPNYSPENFLPSYRRHLGLAGNYGARALMWTIPQERGDSTNAPAYGDRVSGDPGMGMGAQSAPAFANVPEAHGPTQDAEGYYRDNIAVGSQKSATRAPRQISLWKRLLGGKPHDLDSRNAFSENVIPAVGTILPTDTKISPSPAAVDRENAFVVPDPRRVWETPIDPSTGYALDNAGYFLTSHDLEPTDYTIVSRQADPGFNVGIEDPSQVLDRVRAGVASPLPAGEDSNFLVSQGRPARKWGPWVYRPTNTFDTGGMDQNFTGQKGMMKNPLASRPIYTVEEGATKVALQEAAAGGPRYVSSAIGHEAGTTVHPNTDRQVPGSWDNSVVDSGQSDGMAQIQSAYQRGFRL